MSSYYDLDGKHSPRNRWSGVQVVFDRFGPGGRRLLFLPPAEPVAEWLALLRIGTGATVSGGVLLVAGAGKGHRLSVRQVTFIEGHQSGGSSVAAGHRVSQSADDAIQEDVRHCLGLLAARLLVAAIRVEGVVAKGRQQAKVVAHLLTAVSVNGQHQLGVIWVQAVGVVDVAEWGTSRIETWNDGSITD